jgi:hypothetical protein
VPRRVSYLGSVKESFRGDTTDVKTGATDLVFFYQTHGHAQLAGAQCGGVPSRSCSENDKVKSVLSHV